MSDPHEPSSDPWSDPSRPALPRDALAEPPPTPVPDFQAPPPPQYPTPAQYPPQYPTPPQYPGSAPPYPTPVQPYPTPVQPGSPAAPYQQQPSYLPPQYPGTPPYVPAPPYPNHPGQAPPWYPYGYQGWPPPAPPKPKRRVGLIIGIAAGVVVLCLAGAGTLFAIGLNEANRPAQPARPAHVVAEVTGSGPAVVTFTVDGDEEETGTRALPYSVTRDYTRWGKVVNVTARTLTAGATATCRITVDGVVVTTRTATGFDAVATCEAHL